MSTLPRIATTLPTANLITTEQLAGAYARASIPQLRETASRPLFEELLNEYLRCQSLSVYGEQQLDVGFQAVDLAVGYYGKTPLPDLVFVLLAECKRHKLASIGELEAQLEEYTDRYLDTKYGGLARHTMVYGATAYGTKIRFFKFSREAGHLEGLAFSGRFRVADERFYWDLKTDGREIHTALKEIWDFRQRSGLCSNILSTALAVQGQENRLVMDRSNTGIVPGDHKGK